MGGKLNLVIRRKNGKVHKFQTWTGIESNLFHSQQFNEGNDEEALDAFTNFLKKVSVVKNENEEYDGLSPYWYGLIVLDFQENVIHSMQSYSEPGFILLGEFSPYFLSKQDVRDNISKLMALNYFDVYYQNENIGSIQKIFGKNINFSSMGEFNQKSLMNHKFMINQIEINPDLLNFAPIRFRTMKTIHYEIDKIGKDKFQKALINSQFEFTKADNKAWQEYLEY